MYEVYINSHSPIFKTAEKYVKDKLRILKRDFYIEATYEEVSHLKTLKTQTAIDNAILSIINRHWDK